VHVKPLAEATLAAQSRRWDALQPIKTATCLTPDITCRSLDGRPYVACSWNAAKKRKEKTTPFGVNLMRSQVLYLPRGTLQTIPLQTAHGQMLSVAHAVHGSLCASCITRNASTCVNLHRRFWADCDSSMCTHVAGIVVPAVQVNIKLVQALGKFTPHTLQLLHRLIKKWNGWLPGVLRPFGGDLCSSSSRQSSL